MNTPDADRFERFELLSDHARRVLGLDVGPSKSFYAGVDQRAEEVSAE